jgi:ABC-type lipoprotein export system ATPase subunit
MIRLNNVFKYYDSKFQRTFVLKDIDLEISEGEFITIIQVTHNEEFAKYGKRIIRLQDGLISSDN